MLNMVNTTALKNTAFLCNYHFTSFKVVFYYAFGLTVDLDNNNPVSLDSAMIMRENFHEVHGQPSHAPALFAPDVEQSKFLTNIK